MKPTIVPFVKWVGGKRQIIDELTKRVPKQFETYFEPFIGGGALFFALMPNKAFISDLNSELINAYKIIKNKKDILKEYLILMELGHSEEYYKKIVEVEKNNQFDLRNSNLRKSKIFQAARFIYLNKACFNGIYRVNSSGYFNVPSGQKSKIKTFEIDNIDNISHYLKMNNIIIKKMDFKKIKNFINENDFIYFDPPYDFESGKNGFESYQKDGFGKDKQKELAQLCHELNKRKIKFMVSNHNTKLIRHLYQDFNIEVINAKRLVGGKGASREDVEEVIITNYEWN